MSNFAESSYSSSPHISLIKKTNIKSFKKLTENIFVIINKNYLQHNYSVRKNPPKVFAYDRNNFQITYSITKMEQYDCTIKFICEVFTLHFYSYTTYIHLIYN